MGTQGTTKGKKGNTTGMTTTLAKTNYFAGSTQLAGSTGWCRKMFSRKIYHTSSIALSRPIKRRKIGTPGFTCFLYDTAQVIKDTITVALCHGEINFSYFAAAAAPRRCSCFLRELLHLPHKQCSSCDKTWENKKKVHV